MKNDIQNLGLEYLNLLKQQKDLIKSLIDKRIQSGESIDEIYENYQKLEKIASSMQYSWSDTVPAKPIVIGKTRKENIDNRLIFMNYNYRQEVKKYLQNITRQGVPIDIIIEYLQWVSDYIEKLKTPEGIKTISKQTGEISNVKFDDIVGLQDAKKEYEEKILKQIKYRDKYDKYRIRRTAGILLYGLPGTGKTMFAKAVAHELNGKFFSVKSSDIRSMWYGKSERNVKELFEEARKHPVSVVFFDEFESLASTRKEESHHADLAVVDEILAQIQGVDDYKNILLVIAATNFPDKIDSAFLRPGRFDELIYVGLPNDKEKIILLEKGLSIFKKCEVNFKAILPLIKNHSCADIQYIIDKIKIYAVDFEVKFKKEFILTQSILKNKIVDTSSSVDMNDLRRIIAYASERNVNSN